MANFGTHFTYPQPPRASDSGVMFAVETERAAKTAGNAVTRFARRVLAGALRAIDEAPFDLAWPASARGLQTRRSYGVTSESR